MELSIDLRKSRARYQLTIDLRQKWARQQEAEAGILPSSPQPTPHEAAATDLLASGGRPVAPTR